VAGLGAKVRAARNCFSLSVLAVAGNNLSMHAWQYLAVSIMMNSPLRHQRCVGPSGTSIPFDEPTGFLGSYPQREGNCRRLLSVRRHNEARGPSKLGVMVPRGFELVFEFDDDFAIRKFRQFFPSWDQFFIF
jgi:hypothetical protein